MMFWRENEENKLNAMLGQKIASVELDKGKDLLTITFQSGHTQSFSTEGDCCSHSWIEHLELPNDIVGATLLSVEERSFGEIESEDGKEYDSLKSYQTLFKTDRGYISVEYRNSSNGYYGGWMTAL